MKPRIYMLLWLEQRRSQGFRWCCDWNKDEAKVLESFCDWNKDDAKVLDAVVIGTKWNQGLRCRCGWNKDEAKDLDAVVIWTKMKPMC